MADGYNSLKVLKVLKGENRYGVFGICPMCKMFSATWRDAGERRIILSSHNTTNFVMPGGARSRTELCQSAEERLRSKSGARKYVVEVLRIIYSAVGVLMRAQRRSLQLT